MLNHDPNMYVCFKVEGRDGKVDELEGFVGYFYS